MLRSKKVVNFLQGFYFLLSIVSLFGNSGFPVPSGGGDRADRVPNLQRLDFSVPASSVPDPVKE